MRCSQLLDNLKKRALVIELTRDFFRSMDFFEVETPIRCPSIIPEAHIDPVTSQGAYLQASPELCMKRLLARGADKIFQICKCFRQGERGPRHLPELTLLEWYAVDQSYEDLMVQCQDLLRHIAKGLGTPERLIYQGLSLDLENAFERITVSEAFERFCDLSLNQAMDTGRFDEIISFDIEPHLGTSRPCFLYDYPISMASLSAAHSEKPDIAQRFEMYVAGIELANGFTELTDHELQRKRFEKENELRISQGKTNLPLPEKFLSDLAVMPPAAGIALGIDRLVMLFCDAPDIEEVVAFPPELL
ncbi:MAG: EF-P lysine aminoacylase EpmA [Desulfobacter sp.]|jgi:lysyl-tRNA synthetase class 2|uniref:EF-P lysine aminoacylase EpmA n=1 Tax=Desulfobacter sp. TaxID=2294 RepID=UPI000E976372|nr:EF-P lysine aminoacylase EpmA [Desulfobacter sp.]MDQ1269946.1 elongation factor P--(R)-beta-lysine ligase [Thermodesulfobacteriota bacterium]HRF91657.1 EF-P lysine aminoacylase EpmA [Desulfobacter postgatei]MBP8828525.1 EF-P lysine aminoacylase GenX [Desulfobacter sp.]MBP9599144.1 EF-P lysine aminoacylase GenX [Desulfobacter sp.]HBT87836.1 EF-P lysine aminoacylase GenX [Desulfobacter sp.]